MEKMENPTCSCVVFGLLSLGLQKPLSSTYTAFRRQKRKISPPGRCRESITDPTTSEMPPVLPVPRPQLTGPGMVA